MDRRSSGRHEKKTPDPLGPATSGKYDSSLFAGFENGDRHLAESRFPRAVDHLARHPSPFLNHAGRRGLSTLEMVLALPLLLMIMALMVNFGTVAAWKVRGLTVARHAAWSSRWSRNPDRTPRPDYWPSPGTMGAGGAADAPSLDLPAVNLPAARGPSLPLGGIVNHELLDPTRGFLRGSAGMERDFPLLAGLGPYGLDAHTDLLDNQWQFQRMNWPAMGTSIPWNDYRRIPVIYGFPSSDPGLTTAYVSAVVAIYYAPFRPDLFPLDRDDEFRGYLRRFSYSRRFRNRVGGMPEFHPALARYCGLEPGEVRPLVDDLIDQIYGEGDGNQDRGVALTMTDAFINLYEAVIDELNDLISATPSPSASEIAAMQAEIADLQQKISILRQFRATL